ncbi:MAG: DegT/DnrJ/EryC1/StrS family aminotransferase [Candidatus Omnitrophota bacterium]
MKVALFELVRQSKALKDALDPAMASVISKGAFILGENVAKFEEEMAAYCGAEYAVGVANGTDALELAIKALGIGPGDEVITVPFTFIATTEAICLNGATPVLVDIEPDTFNIDASKIEKKITKKTKAIIPVHLFGQACDMPAVAAVSKKHNIKVIEDCAQATGAGFSAASGAARKVGSFGDIGCFSFFPSKNLGCFGDGGMITTGDKALADRIKMLRVHGQAQRYLHEAEGRNSRLDELQAAILRVKLRHLDEWNESRRKNAKYYDSAFAGLKAAGKMVLPSEAAGRRHVYNIYNIRIPGGKRDGLKEALAAKGIGTAVYYPIPLHLQPVYARFGWKKGDFPVSERACGEVLALPVYPELNAEELEYAAKCVTDFMERKL